MILTTTTVCSTQVQLNSPQLKHTLRTTFLFIQNNTQDAYAPHSPHYRSSYLSEDHPRSA